MKIIFSNLFLIVCFWVNAQENLMSKEDGQLNSIQSFCVFQFYVKEIGMSLGLQNSMDGYYKIGACLKDKDNEISYTVIGLKINKNLNYSFFYAPEQNKDNELTGYAYVGFIKREFGETKEYLYRVKKSRVYVENNIFTESVTINNSIVFTIEEKYTIKKVEVFEEGELEVEPYNYEICGLPGSK